MYCLLPLVYKYEYRKYIMHVLLEILCCFLLPYNGGFWVSENQSAIGFSGSPGLASGLDYHLNWCSERFRFLSSHFGFGSMKTPLDLNLPIAIPTRMSYHSHLRRITRRFHYI